MSSVTPMKNYIIFRSARQAKPPCSFRYNPTLSLLPMEEGGGGSRRRREEVGTGGGGRRARWEEEGREEGGGRRRDGGSTLVEEEQRDGYGGRRGVRGRVTERGSERVGCMG